MIQRSEKLCFALEAGETFAIVRELVWEDLDRDVAHELGVESPVDLSRATGTQRRLDLVVAPGARPVKDSSSSKEPSFTASSQRASVLASSNQAFPFIERPRNAWWPFGCRIRCHEPSVGTSQ